MTAEQRILALDAALCAMEGVQVPEEMRVRISNLRGDLDLLVNESLTVKYPTMGEYLDAQKEAVKALVENPQVFGG